MSETVNQPNRALRGVMIGAGFFADIQLDAWSRVEGADIVALCDVDADRASELAGKYDVPQTYTDAEAMLDAQSPDFVDIVTRPDSHLALCHAAANRGIDILCQKPLAGDLPTAERIVALCEDHHVRLMVNENYRWQPWHREMKRLMDDGAIGQPFYARFRIRRGDGRGEEPFADQPYFATMKRLIIFETLIHFIDTSRFLWGQIASIDAITRRVNPRIAGEDLALLTVSMDNGIPVCIDANRWTEPDVEDFKTFGTCLVEGTEGQLELMGTGQIVLRPVGQPPILHEYDWPDRGYFGDSCRANQQHFVDQLRAARPFETSGRENLQTFRAVFGAYESAQTRRAVML